MAPAVLALEETELRLGLPGGGGGGGGEGSEAVKSSGKRSFAETIDLKLQLQTPPAEHPEEEAAAEKGSAAPPKHEYCGSTDDENKPPAPKAQVVGWPPVRSFRKNILSAHRSAAKGGSRGKEEGAGGDKSGNPGTTAAAAAAAAAALVKVSMDGAPYLRKVDLKMYGSYQDLSIALQKMFSSFTTAGSFQQQHQQQGGLMMEGLEMSKVMDALSGSEYVPTYEDRDGDWMLVGDVPWEMFVNSCKRLRIMKGSEAIGLAPRAMEKCKNRS